MHSRTTRVALVMLLALAAARGVTAQEDDLGSLVEFVDALGPSGYLPPVQGEVRPWEEPDRAALLRRLRIIRANDPGLIERATASRPIRLYRVRSLPGGRAPCSAAPLQQALVVADLFFSDRAPPNRFTTMIHELVHLADASRRLAHSEAWVGSTGPRLDRVHAALKERGLNYFAAARSGRHDEVAVAEGLPRLYPCVNLTEALADCTAYMLVEDDYTPPEEMGDFIRLELLSSPAAPDPVDQALHRGLAAMEDGSADQALAAFNEAVTLDPASAFAHACRALAWKAKRDTDRAMADLDRAIDLAGHLRYSVPYLERAALLLGKGEIEGGLADLDAWVEMGPQFEQAYCARGSVRLRLGRQDAALEDFSEVIAHSPTYADAYLGRARVRTAMKDYGLAIADADRVLESGAPAAPAYSVRADARRAAGDYSGALADYNEAIRIEPQSYRAYTGKAWLLAACPDAQHRDGDGAVEAAEEACRLTQRRSAEALEALAAAWAEAGDFDKAAQCQSGALWLVRGAADRAAAQERLELYRNEEPYREPDRAQP